MLQNSVWACAVLGLPLLARCAPAPDRLGDTDGRNHGQQFDMERRQIVDGLDINDLLSGLPLSFAEAAVTQTVVQTVLETRTATSYTTVVTTSSSSSGAAGTSAGTVSTTLESGPSSSVPPAVTSSPAQTTDPPDPGPSDAAFASGASSASSASTVPTSSALATYSSAVVSSVVQPASSAPGSTTVTFIASSGSASATPSSATPMSQSAIPSPSSAPASSPVSSSVPVSPSTLSASNTPPSPSPSGSASANPPIFTKGPSTGNVAKPAPAPVRVKKPLVMAYYPDWVASSFPPEKVDFTRFDWVDFAFAVPTQTFGLGWDGDADTPDLLRRLVSAAHQSGKYVKLSIGGWTGSKYFSPAVSTPQNRQTFVNNILAAYNQFGLDGIDIDWEFPAQDGDKGNIENPNDTANYLAFLQLLRQTLPSAAKISAATMTVPWADPHGNPLKDVSAFGKVLDWILLMNYDTWGSSSVPGPNAPLSNACHNSTQSSASAVAGVMSWTSAGFPVNKIVMGLPSYGYISRSGSTSLMTRSVVHASRRQRRAPHVPMHVDPASQEAQVTTMGEEEDPLAETEGAKSGSSPPAAFMVHNEDGGTEDGQVQFRDLVDQKALSYISAWSSATRVAVAGTAQDGEKTDGPNNSKDAGDGGDTGQSDNSGDAGNADNAGNSDAGSTDPPSDGTSNDSQVGMSSIAFAGQQIDNVFNGQNGFVREWDACSSTPYMHSAAAKQVITYDDPQSLEMKAVFVRAAGLLGANMFDVHGDTDQWDLTDGIRRGLGL